MIQKFWRRSCLACLAAVSCILLTIPVERKAYADGGASILIAAGIGLVLGAGGTWCFFKCFSESEAATLQDIEPSAPAPAPAPAPAIQDTVPSTKAIEILGDKIEVPAPDLDDPNNGIYKIKFQFPKVTGSTPLNNCNIPELKFAVVGQHAFGAWEDQVWNAEIGPSNNFAAVLHIKGSLPVLFTGWLKTKNLRSGGTAEHPTCGSARLSIKREWPQVKG